MQGADINYAEVDGRPLGVRNGRYMTYDETMWLMAVERHRAVVKQAKSKKKSKRKTSSASRKKNRK